MFDYVDGAAGDPRRPSSDAALAAAMRGVPNTDSLSQLLTLDPARLSVDDALRFLEGLERHLGWLHAIQVAALVTVAGRETVVTDAQMADPARREADPGLVDVAREEIASATGWGPGHARHRIEVARTLSAYLPRALQALSEGRMSYAHAAAIADATEQLPGYGDADQAEAFAESCALLEERVLKTALSSSVTRTRRAAARAAIQIGDLDPAHRRRASRLNHSVTVIDDADGSSTLLARMPSHHAHACMAAVRHLANHPLLDLPCDASVGERRAHALATLVIGPHPAEPWSDSNKQATDCNEAYGWSSEDPIGPQPRVHLDLVMSLDALLGLSDQHAVIPGAGHVPANVARGLLADATMRRMITDPMTGHLLDLGRRTYRIPEAVRRFIQARDQTCRFPGCNRRAVHCEIDHALAWSQGGATSPGNLGALCTRHHRMKTHAGWSIQDTDPDGACVWISPLGRSYAHRPPPPLDPLHSTSPTPLPAQHSRPPSGPHTGPFIDEAQAVSEGPTSMKSTGRTKSTGGMNSTDLSLAFPEPDPPPDEPCPF